jgi:hypothetical protein
MTGGLSGAWAQTHRLQGEGERARVGGEGAQHGHGWV